MLSKLSNQEEIILEACEDEVVCKDDKADKGVPSTIFMIPYSQS